MSHITFYRKYRSNTFDEIIGQPHIIETLRNAITNNRLTHAYIFSGPRGTGKTSTARIFAKALNCQKGVTTTPCLTCDLCNKIARGTSIDVIEIDAASNTGVDNIRSLNEQVNFTPVECKYKIYIIDEVHMLSTGAFNALLKTLEEPPKNTIFILATTEPQKIPATIHSRCQRFQFRRLTTQDMIHQLKIITQKEQIQISDKSLHIIARNANGGMRDAISLLDQIYAFKGKTIQEEDVLLILGTANLDHLYQLISLFLDNQIKETLLQLQSLVDEGVTISQLLSDIIQIFQQIILIKLNLKDQIDLDATHLETLSKLSAKKDFAQLKKILEEFSHLEMDIRWFPHPELLLQIKFLTLMDVKEKEAPAIATPVSTQQAIASEPVTSQEPPQSQNHDEETLWKMVLSALKESNRMLYTMLEYSKIGSIQNNKISIHLKEFRFKDFVLNHKESIEQKIAQVFAKSLALEIDEQNQEKTKNPQNPSEFDPTSSDSDSQKSKKINQIIDLFEGTVI